MRRFQENELVIATHNPGKAGEISDLLKPYVSKFLTSKELNLPEPEEIGETFVDNAILKATAAARVSGKPALADDSGLVVNALNGAPGVYSARWAGPEKDFSAAMKKIHEKLGNAEDRSASFICALALAWPDGHAESFEGEISGSLVWPPRGGKGFGYDPIFAPDGHERTFAEMSAQEKHSMSHRARAFGKLVKACFDDGR